MTLLEASAEENVVGRIREAFPHAITEVAVERKGRISVTVKKEYVLELARFLKDELGFDHVISVAGVDYLPPENKMIVIYFLSTYTRREIEPLILSLKVILPRDNPILPTLTRIWPSALYHERETWEMFGITFEGHPKLEKLFLRDNWEGPPPMRKDLRIPEMG